MPIALLTFTLGFMFFPGGASSQTFEPLSCAAELFHHFPRSRGEGCRVFSVVEEIQSTLKITDQADCHFPNQVTIYVYQQKGRIKSDFHGFSGGYLQFAPIHNHTKVHKTCSELLETLEEVRNYSLSKMAPVFSREFSEHDNVMLVASEANCYKFKEELNLLLKLYWSEGRNKSHVVCIPDSLIQQKTPVSIRQYLSQFNRNTEGILLIGDDIPPFELFFETKNPSSYVRGASDLPYGSDLEFWEEPLSKNDPRLKNKIYWKGKSHMMRTDSPSKVAYDMNLFTRKGLHQNYNQHQWVSRYIGENLKHFLERRRNYRPPEKHNVLVAEGLWKSFSNEASEHSRWDELDQANESIRQAFPMSTEVRTYVASDLEGLAHHLDRNVTFLSMGGHGSGTCIDRLSAQNVHDILWFPPLVNLETCYGGYWMYTGEEQGPSYTLIANILHTEFPPLAVTATQAASWLSKIYKSILSPYAEEEVFLRQGTHSKSLGRRQKETIEFNLSIIDNIILSEENFRDLWRKASFAHQMFATYSIFGDGTVEF